MPTCIRTQLFSRLRFLFFSRIFSVLLDKEHKVLIKTSRHSVSFRFFMRPTFLILLISLLSVGQNQRLTKEENEFRKKTCGTNMKCTGDRNGWKQSENRRFSVRSYGRKILNGDHAKIMDAPWNVAVEVMNGVPGLCTGTLISSRHFITARHCFAALRPGSEYRWIAGADEKVPGCDRDEEVDIVVEKNFDDMFKVFIGVDCGYRKNCPGTNFTEIGIRKIVFPKTCDDSQLDFDDFSIVELSQNVEFTKRVRPICLANEDVGLLDSELLTKLYGFGLDRRNLSTKNIYQNCVVFQQQGG